jgi:hypothetical protein
MQSSPASCHFLLLISKYYPRHFVLRYLLLLWEAKFHTHTRQQVKYGFVYFSRSVSREEKVRKRLSRMVGSISRI